jgi:hypothetical protein
MAELESKRERSAVYPYFSWSGCLDFVKLIDSFRASQVSYDEVAKKLGVTAQANSFKAKLSTSKQFGLIETVAGNVIALTTMSRKLLYPTGEVEQEIIYECFRNPPLYAELIKLYNGKALPTEVVLGNILMNNHRISRNAKDVAAKFFISNASEMGFVRAGILSYTLDTFDKPSISIDNMNMEDTTSLEASSTVESPDSPNVPQENRYEPLRMQITASESEYITQSIPTESGQIAKLIIPLEAAEDDLWLIRDTLDNIMKRKFKIKIE